MGALVRTHSRHCLWLVLVVLGQLSACGTRQAPSAGPPPDDGGSALIARAGLPALPQADYFTGPPRQVLAVNSYDGADRLYDSGSGVTVNANNGQWLELDAASATNYAWAVWRFGVSADGPFELFRINVSGTQQRYYVLYGDYTRNRWIFYRLAENPGGFDLTFEIDPATLPGGATALNSPGGFAYLAIIAAPDNSAKLQVKGIDATTPTVVIPGTDPIYDQFENNDTLATCMMLTPGSYSASIHQSNVFEMQDDNERRDYTDCYCIDVPTGKILTATLRHETFDHFGSGFENDCDLLFYMPPASDVGNDFEELISSMGIWYDPFEQVNFPSAADGMYKLAIVGDLSEPGVRTNAEYQLDIFISDAVYTVSGSITQDGNVLDRDVIAFLEPGNFNAATPVPGEGVPGIFTIQGVPPGNYVLKAHGTARFGPTGHEWVESIPVEVTNSNMANQDLDLEPGP